MPYSEPVEVADLSLGRELGRGGMATVLEISDLPAFVVKRYHRPDLLSSEDINRLIDRVRFGRQVAEPQRRLLLDRCAWPVAAVVDGDQLVGCMIPRARARFEVDVSLPSGTQVRRAQDASFLVSDQWRRSRGLSPFDPAARRRSALQLLDFVAYLHRHNWLWGDIAPPNLLVAESGDIFALDLDSDALTSCRQAQTPGWVVEYDRGPSQESDGVKAYWLASLLLQAQTTDDARSSQAWQLLRELRKLNDQEVQLLGN